MCFFFQFKKKNTLNYSKSADMGFFSKGLTNEFERAISVRVTEVLLYTMVCPFVLNMVHSLKLVIYILILADKHEMTGDLADNP